MSTLRDQLRQLVVNNRPWMTCVDEDGLRTIRAMGSEEFADTILAMVDRIARERAAEELRTAGDELWNGLPIPAPAQVVVDRAGVRAHLHRRAGALDTEAHS
jgi:hypothetical protein